MHRFYSSLVACLRSTLTVACLAAVVQTASASPPDQTTVEPRSPSGTTLGTPGGLLSGLPPANLRVGIEPTVVVEPQPMNVAERLTESGGDPELAEFHIVSGPRKSQHFNGEHFVGGLQKSSYREQPWNPARRVWHHYSSGSQMSLYHHP